MKPLLARALAWGWWLPLILPSLWFWVSYPPLWRDSDGYLEIASKPGVMSLVHWPPLYCLGSRLPLALGAWWQGVPFSFKEPALTDAGVSCLLALQHVALWLSVAALIFVATRRNGWRFLLAALFLAFPAFYAYAHTVGTESLSNALLFALFAAGIVVFRARRSWPAWIAWAVLLYLAILTRHVNAVFAAVLPLAFGLRFLFSGRKNLRAELLYLAATVAVGLAAIVAAKITVRVLCAAYDTPYRSRTGYTFQRRMAFLAGLPAPERDAFFAQISAHLTDPAVLEAWESWHQQMNAGAPASADFLSDYLKERLIIGPKISGKERSALVDRQLVAWQKVVVSQHPAPYLAVILKDFSQLPFYTQGELTRDPFACTQWFVSARDEEQFSPLLYLTTFHGGFYEHAVEAWEASLYFRATGWLNVGLLILLDAVLLFVAWFRTRNPALFYPPSLIAVGCLLFALNSCFTAAKPRFALPTFSVLVASLALCLPAALARKEEQ